MSEAAWNKAFTQGSKAMQDRLMKVHAKNPKFQAWLQKSGHGAGVSVKQASKEVKATERAKKLAQQSLKAYGATKGQRMGGEDGSGETLRDTIAPLTRDQHSKVQAAQRAAKAAAKPAKPAAPKKPLTKDQRLAAIAAAARKAKAKHDVPTIDVEDDHDDLRDLHQSLHIRRGYNEEMEKVDEIVGVLAAMDKADKARSSNLKVGDNVRSIKMPIPGKVEKIENGKVYFRHESGKLYATHAGNLRKEEVELEEADMSNKEKKKEYVRQVGLKAMKQGKVDPARGHSPQRFGREILKGAAADRAVRKAMEKELTRMGEEVELEEGRMKNIATDREETARLAAQEKDLPFTPDKNPVRRGRGGPMSQAKWLAKQAMMKKMKEMGMKEEVEQVEEGDLSIRTLYNKYADHYTSDKGNSAKRADAVEKAITKVHGPKVMKHLEKAVKANLRGDMDQEENHFERARNASEKSGSDRVGATVGRDRSKFRKEEIEQTDEALRVKDISVSNTLGSLKKARPGANFIAKDRAQMSRDIAASDVKAIRNKTKGNPEARKAALKRADYAIAKEEVELIEQDDTMEKKEMAQTQLHFMQYAAKEILEFIAMGGQIEEWYQNKLSKVHSDMEGLHSYIEGEKRRTGMVREEAEEVEQIEEGDLSIRTLYNKWADHYTSDKGNSAKRADAVEKAITKVHGPKVMGHLKKAINANLRGDMDQEENNFERARNAAEKSGSDRVGATVGRDRSKFRKEELDPVGKEDKDIDNDGDSDKTDVYLSTKRKAIGKAIKDRLAKKLGK